MRRAGLAALGCAACLVDNPIWDAPGTTDGTIDNTTTAGTAQATSGASDTQDATDATTASPPETGVDSSESDGDDESGTRTDESTGGTGIASCNGYDQSSCPVGEKCNLYETVPFSGLPDAVGCFPLSGEAGAWEPCQLIDGWYTGHDTCAAGLSCLALFSEKANHCLPLCAGDPNMPVCASGETCAAGEEFGACYRTCTIPNDCELGACKPIDDVGNICAYEGPFALGEVCNGGDCGEDLLCVLASELPACEGARCCTALCELGSPCPVGTTCQSFHGAALPEGQQDVGVCRL